ncbi:MAG: ATP-dependent RecD-like DNA helicase [bacterium]
MQEEIDFKRSRSTVAPDSEPLEILKGTVNRVLYHSEETGYCVCGVIPKGKSDKHEVMVVGNCPTAVEGESLEAEGRWTHHAKHGRQFQATRIECHAPVTVEGIKRYLASGMIKGIRAGLADRVVAAFGERTLEIIDKESARLQEVDGIGPQRREMIKESWREQKAVRDIMVFLQSHEVGTACAMRIYKQYGDQSVAVVRENPYRLCYEVWGIGFKTADRIALSLGVPPHSLNRARAGIQYILQTMADEGHCFCPREDLIPAAEQMLEIPGEILKEAIVHGVGDKTLVDERGNVYLSPLYQAETGVARSLDWLMRTKVAHPPVQLEKAVSWAEGQMGIGFALAQRSALEMALSRKVSIITGGPGVGKTTIVRALVDIFNARKLEICLAAPTGRAAKRMEEATRLPAKTIHRLLKYTPGTNRFEHGPDNPLEGDVFILDEVSMIDIQLMNSFLRALPPTATLVLVGDADQLPSVGSGNVLRDMIDSKVIPLTKLETIFRQEAQSWIVRNAHRVNNGLPFEFPENGAPTDFFFIESDTPEDVIAKMLELVSSRIPRKFHFNPMTEVQVLTPMRRNQLGCENLNTILQHTLNPGGTVIKRYGREYKEGDRVLQVRNNYDKDVYNGDIGQVDGVDLEAQEVIVNYDGRRVVYSAEDLDELDLAYACSVHKSQGSEYPAVVLLVTTHHYKLLQRNLLYTAMTRGRKLVCLIGSRKAVHMAIRNNHVSFRRTALKDRLKGML